MEASLPNSFYKASIMLKPKLDKDTTKRKTIKQFPWQTYMQKWLIMYLQTEFNNILKRSQTMIKLVSLQRCKDGWTHAGQQTKYST
jgi:hypothetical protein